MVIHSIIGEYDILYAQEREAAYALRSVQSTDGYDEALFSADCTKLSAETLRLPCDVGSLKSFSVLNKVTSKNHRLKPQHLICLQILRHLAHKFLDIRQYACEISIQSDEKSDCASKALWFLDVTISEKCAVWRLNKATEENFYDSN